MSEPDILRIVHLQGGLRAVDGRTDKVFVQVSEKRRLLHFSTPKYANLYATLQSLGFDVVGVEFISNRGFTAPDWWFAHPEGRFQLTYESRAWSEMRHLASKQGRSDVVDISRRCTAMLELLAIRLLQMSNAYNGAYIAQSRGVCLDRENLFDNAFTAHIEAAIHAFLADAVNLRNLIFEFSWAYVLKRPAKKPSLKQLRATAQDSKNQLVLSMVDAAESGWLKHLSNLRDSVFHVAPIGGQHSFPACHARTVTLPDGGKVNYVSYGLVDRASISTLANDVLSDDNEQQVVAELQAYKVQLDASQDALKFAWTALGQIIKLCESVRIASGIQGEPLTVGPEDIVDFKIFP